MTSRSTSQTITFKNDFRLGGFKKTLPPGTYHVTTEEILLEGTLSPAYRRTQTTLQLPPDRPGTVEYLTVSPCELDAAIERDTAQAKRPRTDDRWTFRTPQELFDQLAIETGEDEGMLWMAEEPYNNPTSKS